MHVAATSCIKNEADVVEAFVRHTLALVNSLYVLDNGSSDGTLQILEALRDEGLALTLLQDATLDYDQASRMTMMMRRAAAEGADLVVPLDCDELLVPGEQGGALADLLPAELPGPIYLDWCTYAPHPADDEAETNPVVRMRHRQRARSGDWHKVAVPAALAKLPGAALVQGNHEVLIDGVLCPATLTLPARMAHFPVRSPGQLLRKIAIGRLQYLAMPHRESGWGKHYIEPLRRIREDPSEFLRGWRDLRWISDVGGAGEELVEAPLQYLGGPLRYSRADAGTLERVVGDLVSHAAVLAQGVAQARLEAEGAQQALERARHEAEAERARLAAAETRAQAERERAGAAEAAAQRAGERAQQAQARADASAQEAARALAAQREAVAALEEMASSTAVRGVRLLHRLAPRLHVAAGGVARTAIELLRRLKQ